MTRSGESAVARHFWDGCAEGELRYERCSRCATVQSYPRGFCTRCGSRETTWERSALRGLVYSAALVRRGAPAPEFEAIAPYALFLAAMDEGFRIMAHGDAALRVGAPVRVSFREVGGCALPYLQALGDLAHPAEDT